MKSGIIRDITGYYGEERGTAGGCDNTGQAGVQREQGVAGGGSGRPLCITQCPKKLRPLLCCHAAYAGLYEEASGERNKHPYLFSRHNL